MSDGDIGLLTQLSQFDEVEAMTVGSEDSLEGNVADSCELVLDLRSGHQTQRLQLTRHDGELIIEVLHTVLHPNTHRSSPVQRLWAELDDVMDFLMVDDPEPEDKARAKALAEAIAMLATPYSEEPDIDAVRKEAVERWEQRDE